MPDILSEEQQWRVDAKQFTRAVLWNWHTWLGTVGGLGIMVVLEMLRTAIPIWAVPWIMAIGLVWEAFDAWTKERRKKEAAEVEVSKFIDLKKPRIEPSICQPEDNGSNRVFLLGLTNTSSLDIEACTVRLIKITNKNKEWICNDFLTFQPSAQHDPKGKTLQPSSEPYKVDVIFFHPDSFRKFKPGTEVLPDGTHSWNHGYQFHEAVSEYGIYIFSILVTGKNLYPEVKRELRFTCADRIAMLELMPPS